MDQPQSLETLPMPTTPATPVVHQVNLLLLLLQEQGDLASMVLETRSHRTPRETHRSLANPNQTKWKSTTCACFPYTNVYPKGRQAHSLLQTTMEPLPHGLWSRSSESLTGRTGQAEGRFSYWNYTGDITTAWYTGILHRTRTRRNRRRHAL